MQITSITDTIGAEVTDVTGDDLTAPEVAAQLLEALEAHGVLVFRNLHLDDPQQVAFSRLLGEVEILPIPGLEHPEIFTVSLDPEKTLSAEYLKGTFHWHIDGATDDVPNMATMLNALDVSATGGETEFCNTYAAWDALSDEDKQRYRHLRVHHSFETAQRRVYPDPTDEQVEFWRTRPAKEQPLAWRHESGRISLVLGATASHIVGMDEAQSAELIEHLQEWTTSPRFSHRHEWQIGDLVIWDNRGTMHRALPYTADSGRLMHRTTIVGDEAFA